MIGTLSEHQFLSLFQLSASIVDFLLNAFICCLPHGAISGNEEASYKTRAKYTRSLMLPTISLFVFCNGRPRLESYEGIIFEKGEVIILQVLIVNWTKDPFMLFDLFSFGATILETIEWAWLEEILQQF